MGTFRFAVALVIAKLMTLILSVVRMNDSDLPGVVALKICPDFLERIAKPTKIVAVTGTNGRDTVTKLISECIRAMEIQVLSNTASTDTEPGIVAALVNGVSLLGREKYGTAVFEIDEASVKDVFPWVEPDLLLVNNLSRESTVKKAHPEYAQKLLTHYIPSKTKLVLNADDLMTSGVAPSNSRKYFGIASMPGDKKFNTNLIDDYPVCPVCHKRLAYEYNRYSNIGKSYCPDCGFRSPGYDYTGELQQGDTKKYIKIITDTRSESFPLLHDSVFNIYNQVAAISTLLEMGVRMVDIKTAISKVNIFDDRLETARVGDIKVTSMLCKEENAYSTTRVFEYIAKARGNKEILLLNNNLSDAEKYSENISWLYDCDFELLNNSSIKKIVVFGDRSWDYKLRMLLAGIPEEIIVGVKEYKDAAEALDYFDNDNIYILYGTEPIKVGREVTDAVLELARVKMGGEPDEDRTPVS